MSRQIVLNRRGKPVGYIDTGRDGQQSAVCQRGAVLGTYDPRVGETFTPTGRMIAEGNRLMELLNSQR